MPQASARLPQELVRQMDDAARRLNRSRADFIRTAIEYSLEDFEDLKLALERLQGPSDVVLDWQDVRDELLRQD